MMKKMWKNRSGVSPVIATILMVAITVVLAAVLYVMVMGFGGPSSNTPTGSLTAAKTSTGYTVTLASISKADVAITDTKVVLSPAGANTPDTAMTAASTGSTVLTAGDYVEFTTGTGGNLAAGTTYTVSLIYTPTGNAIASTTIVVPA